MRTSAAITGFVILLLAIAAAAIWYVAWYDNRQGVLSVSFLDVGQGDAILIVAPSGRKVLIDGGPDSAVLRRLGSVLPWYDRSIDVAIPTHPDADHIAGLIPVLSRYQVSTVIEPSVAGDTATASNLSRAIQQENASATVARRGQVVDLGAGVYLEVLSPDRLLPRAETNIACTVTRLIYGSTSFIFDCDAPQAVENYLVSLDGKQLHGDVLKAGHHGSKTSSSIFFVGYVNPLWVVYSRGCDNKYGFPHQETIDLFTRFGVQSADTCTDGTVTFESDGLKVWRE